MNRIWKSVITTVFVICLAGLGSFVHADIAETQTAIADQQTAVAGVIETLTQEALLSETPTFTNTITNTFTPTITNTFTKTITPSITNTFTNTFTKTVTPTFTKTFTKTVTNTFTKTVTNTYTVTLTSTPTPKYLEDYAANTRDWTNMNNVNIHGPFFNAFADVSINTQTAYIVSGTKSLKVSSHFCCGDWPWSSKYGVITKEFPIAVDLSGTTVSASILTKNIQSTGIAGLYAKLEFVSSNDDKFVSPIKFFDNNTNISFAMPMTGPASSIKYVRFYIQKDFTKGYEFQGDLYISDFKYY